MGKMPKNADTMLNEANFNIGCPLTKRVRFVASFKHTNFLEMLQ